MAAKKKSAKKAAAKRTGSAAKAKPKARRSAAAKPRARAAQGDDVVYSDVLHQLRSSLVARLMR